MSSAFKILVIAHNHPSFHPGGTEIVAHSLFQHWRDHQGFEANFMAAASPEQRHANPGTVIQAIPGAPSEFLVRVGAYDIFHHLQRDKIAVFNGIGEILHSLRPNVVHLHHFLGLGSEIIPFVRRCLPDSTVILTVHDYYFACHNDGVMTKVGSGRLCHQPSIDACHDCFPMIPAGSFKLRELNLKHHFAAADHFVAPSEIMRDRLVAWGLDDSRVSVIRNGRDLSAPVPTRPLGEGERRSKFAVLGNVSPAKGQSVALRAFELLLAQGIRDIDLTILGATLFQTDAFKAEIEGLISKCGGNARMIGGYEQDELPGLLSNIDWILMPSLWWENAPLVLDEAFHHGRPPICSAVGGMAERIRDGVDGLHFGIGDPHALASRMRQALEDQTLWERLRQAAPRTRTTADCARDYEALFEKLALDCNPSQPRARRSKPKRRPTRARTALAQ